MRNPDPPNRTYNVHELYRLCAIVVITHLFPSPPRNPSAASRRTAADRTIAEIRLLGRVQGMQRRTLSSPSRHPDRNAIHNAKELCFTSVFMLISGVMCVCGCVYVLRAKQLKRIMIYSDWSVRVV